MKSETHNFEHQKNDGRAPLAGYRVLDLSHLLPGDFATMWLGDLGADVIKIEAPAAQAGGLSMLRDSANPYRTALNRTKRSITLNLKTEEGQAILHRLVETADVVVEGFRPGVTERLGADYETLRRINAKLIYCSISGYGQTGPYRERPGHDNNYLALAGLLSRNRGTHGTPHLLPVQLADVGGGAMPAVVAILSALLAREQTGEGQFLDVSMLDGALAWSYLLLPLTHAASTPESPSAILEPGLLTGDVPCYNVYETADERYLAVGTLEPKFWQRLCIALGRTDLVGRAFDRSAVPEVRRVFRSRRLDEWMETLDPAEHPITPLLDFDEMLDDPHVQAREIIFTDAQDIPHARFPVRFGGMPAYRSAPEVGEHTGTLLRKELELPEDEIARLEEAGII